MNKKNVLHIINQYPSLRFGLKYLVENNKSNHAPYHNFNHMLTVVKNCYQALDFMKMLEDDKVEALLMAALFHDFNHSMGRRDDAFNVEQAIVGLGTFLSEYQIVHLDFEFMKEIIYATQYPYVIKVDDLNIYQSIIRDADLCQILEYDWIKQMVLGLSEEMHYPVNQLMIGQRVFLDNIKFITPYGEFVHDNYYKGVMDDFTLLENILK